MSRRIATIFPAVAVLVGGACSRDAKTPEEPMAPAFDQRQEIAPFPEYESAGADQQQAATDASSPASPSQKIAEARCDREQRCDNVGPGKLYSSREICVEAVRANWKQELGERECPGGVVPDAFAQCLQEVRDRGCDNVWGTLERFMACDTSDICSDAP